MKLCNASLSIVRLRLNFSNIADCWGTPTSCRRLEVGAGRRLESRSSVTDFQYAG